MVKQEEEFDRYPSHDVLIEAMHDFASPRIVAAMSIVPRDLFIDGRQKNARFDDRAIFIPGYRGKSSVSQPKTVAMMTEALDPQPKDIILEIGTASGWQAAILSHLAKEVVSVEYLHKLAHKSKKRLEQLGISNVHLVVADGSSLFTVPGIFDKIMVTASLPPFMHQDLFDLLKEGGRIVAPIGGVKGEPCECDLVVLSKQDDQMIEEQRMPNFSFVPMEGFYGWKNFTRYAIATFGEVFHDKISRPQTSTETQPTTEQEE